MGMSSIDLPRATRWALLGSLGLLLVRSAPPAHAVDGFAISRSTIDGGGATFSTGGAFRLGGTIGQPDAGTVSGGSFVLSGGFWPDALAVPSPTPSATASGTPTRTGTRAATATATGVATSTASGTATRTATASVTRTGPPPATPTASRSATVTATAPASATPTPSTTGSRPPSTSATPTPSRTPGPPTPMDTESPTPSPTPPPCAGDCNRNQVVAIDELIRGVNIALGELPLDACPAFDGNGDQRVGVDELITAVNNTLLGCPPRSTVSGSGPSLAWAISGEDGQRFTLPPEL